MQRPNSFSFQRFQFNGSRHGGFQGRAFSGPLSMIIAVVMFFILLGATIIGSVAFLLIRTLVNLIRAIGQSISTALPSGRKARTTPRQPAGKTQADSGPSPSTAKPQKEPVSQTPKTIALHKDASGAWRSGE